MSRSCSVLLDVMRFGAAVTVLLSHLGETRFSIGLPFLASAGHLAVAVFFVLSGFVIRYVTLQREATAGEYLVDRASRIYSVVVPALVITVLCEAAALAIRPDYYAMIREPFLWRIVPFQIAANLAFQAQNCGYAIYPLSNLPFWSLSFECLYYAVYGLNFYQIRGAKIWTILLFLISGPSIALMFPIWLMGCLSYDSYCYLRARKNGFITASASCAAIFLIMLAAHGQMLRLLVLTREANRTAWLSGWMLHVPSHALFFSHGEVPWLVDATPSYFVIGPITAIFTAWAALTFDRFGLDVPERIARPVRVIADSTFALYLLHLPFIILIVTVFGRQMHLITAIAVGCAITFICIGLGRFFDILKRSMRNWMGRFRLARREALKY